MSSRWWTVVMAVAVVAGGACKGTKASDSAPAAPPSAAASAPVNANDETRPLPDPLPDVAGTVNGHDIPTRNVKILAEGFLQQGALPPNQRAVAYRRALNQFVVRELLLEEAIARGIQADEAKMREAESQARASYKDDKSWQAFLAAQGMDEAGFKAELRTQATVNALTQKESEKITPASVTDDDLKRYYDANPDQFTARDRVKMAHIFIRVPADVAPDRKGLFRTKAEGLLAKAKTGGDFAALAKANSEDPASRNRGGEMEPFSRGQLPAPLRPLEEAVATLKPGEVAPAVVESGAGFHVVKLLERLPDERIPLEKVKPQLRQFLVNQKLQENMQKLVNDLRTKAKIEMRL